MKTINRNSKENFSNKLLKILKKLYQNSLNLSLDKNERDHILKKISDYIKKGADVNVTDDNGNTPLIIACGVFDNAIYFSFYKQILETLIKAGVDVNAKNKDGDTALIQLAKQMKYHPELFKVLFNADADPTIKNNEGNIALTYAQANPNLQGSFFSIGHNWYYAQIRDLLVKETSKAEKRNFVEAVITVVQGARPSQPDNAYLKSLPTDLLLKIFDYVLGKEKKHALPLCLLVMSNLGIYPRRENNFHWATHFNGKQILRERNANTNASPCPPPKERLNLI